MDLSPEEKRLIESIKKDYNKSRALLFAGIFIALVGLLVGVLNIFYILEDSYYIVSIFCISVGYIVIKNSIRNKKTHKLLEKLLETNRS